MAHIMVTETAPADQKKVKNPLMSHKQTMAGSNSLHAAQLNQTHKKAKTKVSQLPSNILTNPDFIGGGGAVGQNTSNSIGVYPMSFSDTAENRFHDIDDTVNQMSID